MEGLWKEDELNGFGKIQYSKNDLPKLLDPKGPAATILAYEGYLKDSRLDGQGKAV